MSKKAPKRTTRKATVKLSSNDALRLAVADERFASALIKNPEKFKGMFNLREDEVAAIRDAIRPGRPGPGMPGDIAAAYD